MAAAPPALSISSLHYGQCPQKPGHLYSTLPPAPDGDAAAAPTPFSVEQFLSAPARDGNIFAVLMSGSPPASAAPARPGAQGAGAGGATPQSSA